MPPKSRLRTTMSLSSTVLCTLLFSAPHAQAIPPFAQIEHSTSLTPVGAEFLPGKIFAKDAKDAKNDKDAKDGKDASNDPKPPNVQRDQDLSSTGWSRIPPRIAGRWKLERVYDVFTDAFDVDKLHDLPKVEKPKTEMLVGLRQDNHENVWDSEDLNSKVEKFGQVDIVDKWQLNFGGDHSMSLMQEKKSFELDPLKKGGAESNTIKNVFLSETIINFELTADDKLETKISTKWFTPEGEALAISRSTNEYKREAPFKDVDALNGAELKPLFDSFLSKRGKK